MTSNTIRHRRAEPVRVKPGGRQPEHLVPDPDGGPVDEPRALHDTYGEAGQVALAGRVIAGVLGHLTANQKRSRPAGSPRRYPPTTVSICAGSSRPTAM